MKNEELSQLPAFGALKTCPKCGSDKRSVRWDGTWRSSLGSSARAVMNDMMLVTCDACGFHWHELPLEASPAPQPEAAPKSASAPPPKPDPRYPRPELVDEWLMLLAMYGVDLRLHPDARIPHTLALEDMIERHRYDLIRRATKS